MSIYNICHIYLHIFKITYTIYNIYKYSGPLTNTGLNFVQTLICGSQLYADSYSFRSVLFIAFSTHG